MALELIATSGLVFLLGVFAQTHLNSPETVAEVNGEVVTANDLLSVYTPQFRNLANQEFELRKKALDEIITRKLLQREAVKQSMTAEELLHREVEANVSEPSLAEIEAFYLGQKDRIGRPFQDVKQQLSTSLKQARIQQKREEFLAGLRKSARITILLEPPRVTVAPDPGRTRGDAAAPVTIVEFSDFQCPYCQRIQTTLHDLAAKYPGRIRLSFRDYPLRTIHPQAQAAAEAARCAGDQGKFWEYHDTLFANPAKLGAADLVAHARTLQLDDKRFEDCVKSGKHKAAIDRDLKDGADAGVTGTPAFFVNGIYVNGAVPAATFERMIERELADRREVPPAR